MSFSSESVPVPLSVTTAPASMSDWSTPASAVGASFTFVRVTVRSAVAALSPSLTRTVTW